MSEKKIIFILLFVSVATFFVFGLYHLTKFETVDEHFWKYERITKYWDSILEHNAKGTYINDKPGVTTAMISGAGLLFEPHPQDHRIKDKKTTQNNELTVYDSSKTEKINLALRLPIIIFNGLFIFFLFWMISILTGNRWIALFSSILIATSPVLIGISQIINPDSFLWSFSFAAVLSYLTLLKTREKKFILFTGVLTGLALLSKYTANILFPVYILLFLSNFFIHFEKMKEESNNYFLREVKNFFYILLIAVAVFSFFMPAAIVKPKYLYRGTIGFSGMKVLLIPLVVFFISLVSDSLFLKNNIYKTILFWINRHQKFLFRFVASLMLATFVFILINCLTGQRLVPFDLLRNEAYFNNEMTFGRLLDKDNALVSATKQMLLEFYPFVFSLSPVVLFLVFFLWIKTIIKGTTNFRLIVFFITLFPFIYFGASLVSEVLTNTRYSLMLYPLFYLLAAIALWELIISIKGNKKTSLVSAAFVLLLFNIYTLFVTKPFYFTYTNSLLPKNFMISDAWGYGEYEAAEYLNSLPNAKNLIVWSDRSAVCQFILGRCVRDYKIDLTKVQPDYFVFSRRGAIRHKFEWEHPEMAKKGNLDYYKDLETKYAWSLAIDGRPSNFIKVVNADVK